jgi:protein-L-isoaspartate O-methyltransferase
MAKHTTISPEALAVLKAGSFAHDPLLPGEGWRFFLPKGQLARPLYDAVNKALLAAGGKWNRGAQAHVFQRDPRAQLGVAIDTGKIENRQQVTQQFFTPVRVAERMAGLADLHPEHMVLEPSFGTGRLLEQIVKVRSVRATAVELDPDLVQAAAAAFPGVQIIEGDFLQWGGGRAGFDRILMNPPFSGGQDVRHILHAYDKLAPGGRLVAICGAGPKQEARLYQAAEAWYELEPGTFKQEGTGVGTVVLILNHDARTTARLFTEGGAL